MKKISSTIVNGAISLSASFYETTLCLQHTNCWAIGWWDGEFHLLLEFKTLSEAFKTFKFLLFNEEQDNWDADISGEDLAEWQKASVGLA